MLGDEIGEAVSSKRSKINSPSSKRVGTNQNSSFHVSQKQGNDSVIKNDPEQSNNGPNKSLNSQNHRLNLKNRIGGAFENLTV